MNYLKALWNEDYLVFRINKKILLLFLAIYGLWYAKQYYFLKGADAAFKYDLEHSKDAEKDSLNFIPDFRSDGEPGAIGKNYDMSC